MSQNKIFFRSFLSQPWKQAKYAFLVGFCFSAVNLVSLYYVNFKLKNHSWEATVDWNTISKVSLELDSYSIDAAIYGTLIGFSISFGLMIYITHRFVGPYVSIQRFIVAHLKNEHPADLRIRKNDEIHEIVELINLLAKKGSSPMKVGSNKS